MMMSPDTFLAEYENATYMELLKLKNELVHCIEDFEKDYDQEEPRWNMNPSPDVGYQWNLEVLGKVSILLKEAFNKEYEWGEKSITDYYKEMRSNDL